MIVSIPIYLCIFMGINFVLEDRWSLTRKPRMLAIATNKSSIHTGPNNEELQKEKYRKPIYEAMNRVFINKFWIYLF